MKELDMNGINVNTKEHERMILLNINSQSLKELNMNVTSVNTNLRYRDIWNQSMKELIINVTNVSVKLHGTYLMDHIK